MKKYRKRILLRTAFPVSLALSLLSPTLAAITDSRPKASAAVIYSEAGDSAELMQVLDGIEHASDVVVYRLRLAASEPVSGLLARADNVKLALGGDPGNIAVLYPDLGEPYRGIFAKIIEGIEVQAGVRVVSYAVGGSMTAQEIVVKMKQQDIKVVIALGRQGMKAAAGMEREFGVVAGGVVSAPEGDGRKFPVVSLAPDPGMLFERLKHFMPDARRVIVVYDPKNNAWLMRLARDAARKHGLELQAVEAADLKSAVRIYQELLLSVDPKKDALWLPQDSTTVEETSVLPLVLEGAWSRNLAVFSSSMAHVKRGALFSLYPNNLALGRQLANSALNYSASSPPISSVVPMKEALLAVNVRTASHLGLQLSPSQQSFDLVFPAP